MCHRLCQCWKITFVAKLRPALIRRSISIVGISRILLRLLFLGRIVPRESVLFTQPTTQVHLLAAQAAKRRVKVALAFDRFAAHRAPHLAHTVDFYWGGRTRSRSRA